MGKNKEILFAVYIDRKRNLSWSYNEKINTKGMYGVLGVLDIAKETLKKDLIEELKLIE